MATLAQQKPRELLTRAAQCPHRIEAGPYQVAHCLMSAGTHTAVNSPARCSFARLTASRRSVLTRSPGRFGVSDGATTTQSCPRADK